MEEGYTENKGYAKRPLWQWIVLYIIIGGLAYGLVYYFIIAKKDGNNSYNSSPVYTGPTAVPSPIQSSTSNEIMVTLSEENKSGETGTVTLKEENGSTTVTLALTGFTKGVAQPAHIHVGNCPGVGAVKYPLTNVVDGQSVTVLQVTLAQLKQQLPLAINVHKSAAEIATYTSCGQVTAQ